MMIVNCSVDSVLLSNSLKLKRYITGMSNMLYSTVIDLMSAVTALAHTVQTIFVALVL